jgi:phosphohistidine phosphatase SixA
MSSQRRSLLVASSVAAALGPAALRVSKAAADVPRLSMDEAAARLLEQGDAVLFMRHELTEPGVGDPPSFRLGDCSTQRNLSTEGRSRARERGRALLALGIKPSKVLSSRWCRCIDTGQLAFGAVDPWPALDSFFAQPERQAPQVSALSAGLDRFEGPQPWMLVTHQVNISGFLGVWTSMGEIVAAQRRRSGEGPGWRPLFRF